MVRNCIARNQRSRHHQHVCRPRTGAVGATQVTSGALEQENDDAIGLLEGKAKQLRELSSNIRDEVRLHNSVLDRVGLSMGGAGDMLKSSANKFNKVFSHAENRILAYVVTGCMIVFVLFFYFKRSSSL